MPKIDIVPKVIKKIMGYETREDFIPKELYERFKNRIGINIDKDYDLCLVRVYLNENEFNKYKSSLENRLDKENGDLRYKHDDRQICWTKRIKSKEGVEGDLEIWNLSVGEITLGVYLTDKTRREINGKWDHRIDKGEQNAKKELETATMSLVYEFLTPELNSLLSTIKETDREGEEKEDTYR